jgi:hypothetical protein
MKQTKKQSFTEAITNTFIGFIISLAATFIVFPLFGIQTTVLDNIGITIFYTAISIIRSYVIRRWFNNKKPKHDYIKHLNGSKFLIHCFECEYEMSCYSVDDSIFCCNCNLKH